MVAAFLSEAFGALVAPVGGLAVVASAFSELGSSFWLMVMSFTVLSR
jgi:hypothetical protein